MTPREDALCPVCGMRVERPGKVPPLTHRGIPHHFCAQVCRSSFAADPDRYTTNKGRVRRWLERMGRVNEREFGKKGPSCCGG